MKWTYYSRVSPQMRRNLGRHAGRQTRRQVHACVTHIQAGRQTAKHEDLHKRKQPIKPYLCQTNTTCRSKASPHPLPLPHPYFHPPSHAKPRPGSVSPPPVDPVFLGAAGLAGAARTVDQTAFTDVIKRECWRHKNAAKTERALINRRLRQRLMWRR